MQFRRLPVLLAGGVCLAALIASQPAAAGTVVYENVATNLAIPPNVSFHNAAGPVIADDFAPTQNGSVGHLTWWGSSATDLNFEVVLQNDNPTAHEPDLTPTGNTTTGGLKQFVSATMSAFSIPGLFQFDADVAPGWLLSGGQEYWLTVANASNGWQWAEALAGPTVGSELYNAHRSVGPGCLDGGPHCGPWTDIHTDFGFRVASVPEPATWAMMIMGFGGLGAVMRRRRGEAATTA